MSSVTRIPLTWVAWPFPDQGIGGWKAHVRLPDSEKTACGITTTLGKGAQEIGGVFFEDERPVTVTCCRECLRMRASIADRVRLQAWQKATQ